MEIFKTCASIGLGMWVGGLSFGGWRRDADTASAAAALDRWGMIWGSATCFFLYMVFLGRHFETRSLFLEVPVLVMALLTLHAVMVLHPQITDLRRQIADPKYAGTARLVKLQFCFDRLHRRSVQLRGAVLFLGWFMLGLVPRLL